MPTNAAFGMQRQEDLYDFQANEIYIVRPCLKIKKLDCECSFTSCCISCNLLVERTQHKDLWQTNKQFIFNNFVLRTLPEKKLYDFYVTHDCYTNKIKF